VSGKNSINWRNVGTILSLMILVGAEIFGVALASGWAIAGWFQLGTTIEHALMGLFCLIGAYALFLFMRKAVSVEPISR
jgi:hypothetical protein